MNWDCSSVSEVALDLWGNIQVALLVYRRRVSFYWFFSSNDIDSFLIILSLIVPV